MRAKGTVPVYVEVDSAMEHRLRRAVKAKGWTLAQAVRVAIQEWLWTNWSGGHNKDGGRDGEKD